MKPRPDPDQSAVGARHQPIETFKLRLTFPTFERLVAMASQRDEDWQRDPVRHANALVVDLINEAFERLPPDQQATLTKTFRIGRS
jgi:hypothetical protein